MQKLSRSKIELLSECLRCFWLDVKHGIKRPPPAPYTINNAIDYLLKQEFDVHREKGTRHPIMERHGIDALPFAHEKMNQWRHNFTGVQYHHKPTDLLVFGAVDDIWTNPDGELIVVDYKATGAKQHQIYDSYKRQMEIYQWLLEQNGFRVSSVGYFVFARVQKANGFSALGALLPDGQGSASGGGFGTAALSFDLFVEAQEGDRSWIEESLRKARATIDAEKAPSPARECVYCEYRRSASETLPS